MVPEPLCGPTGGYACKDIGLKDPLEAFDAVHMASRNLAERTRREYMNDLTDLVAFLEKLALKRISQVDRRRLEAYQADLDRRGYAGSTRRRRTSSIRSLFGFLKRDGHIERNVAERLIPPNAEQKQPRVLSEREYKDLLRAYAHQTRDGAIIELPPQTGIRLSELSRLTLQGTELPARIQRNLGTVGVLHVRGGKGRRDRYVASLCRSAEEPLRVGSNPTRPMRRRTRHA